MPKKRDTEKNRNKGSKGSARHFDPGWYLLIAVVLIILILVITNPDPYLNMLIFFRAGIWITIYVTVISFLLVLVVGLFGGLGRVSSNKIIRGIATTYVEIIRGIPLLVQLLFWYFAMPALLQSIGRATGNEALAHYQTNAIVMAIVGLTIGYGAYMSEVVRAGIESIGKGQMEAARSLGLTYFQAMRHVILPQAFRVILPAIGNEFITLLKDSSLVSVVAVADLTRRGREYSAIHFNTLQTWSMVALVYLVMTLLAARVVAYTERKTKSER
jgi:polar amino acid transport system permease protein